jgi:ferredoxin
MKVSVTDEKSVSAGQYMLLAPRVFDQREKDGMVVLLDEAPEPELHDAGSRVGHGVPDGSRPRGGLVNQVVIAGTSTGGLSAAETPRTAGYRGTITLTGDEPLMLCDLPPLPESGPGEEIQGLLPAVAAEMKSPTK